ncbi:uncharacterized protein [Amphiura filiformis]|uniref:uncharacterized protein n=1 Tax=Amphiura filiformis TaxID=82378 RepID=UPI003B2191D4
MPDKKDGNKGERRTRRRDIEQREDDSTDTIDTQSSEARTDGQDGDGAIMRELNKITKLLNKVISRLDTMEVSMQKLESDQKDMRTKVIDLEASAEQVNATLEDMKQERKSFVMKTELDSMKQQLDDLANRSRRNNLVFWGIPENSENSPDCCGFMEDFIVNYMQVENGENIEIERAHRSPMGKMAAQQAIRRGAPRPMFVKLLRYPDREVLLKSASKYLKDKEYRGEKIFITDDVTQAVRAERKQLIGLRKKLIKEGKYAFVPWTVPACLLVKRGGAYKKLTVSDIEDFNSEDLDNFKK